MNEEPINQLIGKGKIVKLKREKFFEILNYQGDLFFQKGKLEQKKDELKFLKKPKGFGYGAFEEVKLRIKQLQKEIREEKQDDTL